MPPSELAARAADEVARAAEAVARSSYGKLVAYLSARTRDVAGAEVEELDLVHRVDDPQFLGLPALLVAGLMQHLRRRA